MGKRLIPYLILACLCVSIHGHLSAYSSSKSTYQNSTANPLQKITIKEIIQKNLASTVTIWSENDSTHSSGSGAVIHKDGLVVTCYHVINEIKHGTVQFEDGQRSVIADIVAVDPLNDLAIIKINPLNTSPIRLGESRKMELGDEIVVIGSPKGLSSTVSTGIISAIRPELNKLQFTAAISPGSSGGPLFNQYGELVGVTTFTLLDSQNLNFAIPSIYIQELLMSISPVNSSNQPDNLKYALNRATEQYLAQHDKEESVRLFKAQYLLEKGDMSKSLEALGESDTSDAANKVRAVAYFLLNQPDKALDYFEKLSDSHYQQNPELSLYVANIHLSKKSLFKAKQSLEKYNVSTSNKNAFYYYTVAELATEYAFSESRQLDQDQYFEKAIGFYEIAEQMDPKFFSATYKKGLVELTMGDIKNANQTYQTLLVKNEAMAKQLEGQIVHYIEAYNLSQAHYYRELAKAQLYNNLSTLLVTLIYALAEASY